MPLGRLLGRKEGTWENSSGQLTTAVDTRLVSASNNHTTQVYAMEDKSAVLLALCHKKEVDNLQFLKLKFSDTEKLMILYSKESEFIMKLNEN